MIKQLQKISIHSYSLRHAYAQKLYFELTGWRSLIAGNQKK